MKERDSGIRKRIEDLGLDRKPLHTHTHCTASRTLRARHRFRHTHGSTTFFARFKYIKIVCTVSDAIIESGV